MTGFLEDVRYAIRGLRAQPGYLALAVATLALTIGANATMFAVVRGVLLRPLPFERPDELSALHETYRQWRRITPSPANLLAWDDRTAVFETLAGVVQASMNLATLERPERVDGGLVTANYLDTFGVNPLLGRRFLPSDDAPGAAPVVVLSHDLWRSRFGANPDIVGSNVRLDSRPHTVIGVMPQGFEPSYPAAQSFWVPGLMSIAGAQQDAKSYRYHWVSVVGRRAPGVSPEQAAIELNRLAEQLGGEHPASNEGWGVNVVSLHEQTVGGARSSLTLLLLAVGLLLLVGCANVTNLMLARSTTRLRETALRLALGASCGRVRRQALAEAAAVALIGGGIGVLVATWATRALISLQPGNLPRAGDIGTDATVIAFAFGLSLLTGLGIGLVPAWRVRDVDVERVLRDSNAQYGGGRTGISASNALVAAQAALVFVLLAGAGVMLSSLERLDRVDLGFDTGGSLTLELSFPDTKYPQTRDVGVALERMRAQMAALPGVAAVGMTTGLPFSGRDMFFPTLVEGRDRQDADADVPSILQGVTVGYMEALGVPLIQGRRLRPGDDTAAPRVALVNKALVEHYFPDDEATGGRFRYQVSGEEITIVGIVANSKHIGVDNRVNPTMYVPYSQLGVLSQHADLLVRSAGPPPLELLPEIRQAVAAVDPDQAIAAVATLEDNRRSATAGSRFRATLLSLFAAFGLSLGAVGIYGVVSYSTNQRRQEFGIRMALGATMGTLLRLVVGRGMLPVLVGIGAGTVVAFGLSRLVSSLMYEVSPSDPAIFAGVALLLIVTAAVAGLLPALRVTRIDPTRSLKAD